VLGAAGSRVALPFAELYFRRKQIHRSTSHFAAERQQELAARLARGETAYLAGISIGGFHNSGVALIEVSPEAGLRIICNNEEERFSGRKHANNYPSASLEALTDIMRRLGISPERIVAWLGTYDYPLLVATGIRSVLEEFPASMHLMFQDPSPTFDGNHFRAGICAPVRLGQLFGLGSAVPIVGMAHHRQSRMVLIFGLTVRQGSATGGDCGYRRLRRFRFDLPLSGRERNCQTNPHQWQCF
jgi:carbamoyltransferase